MRYATPRGRDGDAPPVRVAPRSLESGIASQRCNLRLAIAQPQVAGVTDGWTYNPNTNSARPADMAMTCRPSTVKEIGGDNVGPPRGTRHNSRPVIDSIANASPPEAPKTNPPPVASRPL